MSQIERKLPSGIHVIERYTEKYYAVTLTSSAITITNETLTTNLLPFQLAAGFYPTGHAVRAVYVDLFVPRSSNSSASVNSLERPGADTDDLFPWQVKRASGGVPAWTTAGNARMNDFQTVALGVDVYNPPIMGDVDVKAEVDRDVQLEFRLGDGSSEGWASTSASLYLGLFQFRVRIEMI